MKRKCGSIYDRSDDVNPPLLPPECDSIYDRSDNINPPPLPPDSPAYAIDILCVHSNIPNNGEILLLPLFSPVYRVEQADEIDNVKFQSITDAVPPAATTTTAPVTHMDIVLTKDITLSSNLNVVAAAICMDIVWIEDVSSNLNAVAVATDDDDNENNLNAKLKLYDGILIGTLSNMPYIHPIIGEFKTICDKVNEKF